MPKRITIEHLYRGARRILRGAEQMIRDIEWWNTHRTDAPPMDLEGERLLAALARQQIAALDRRDMAEVERLSGVIVERAELNVRENE